MLLFEYKRLVAMIESSVSFHRYCNTFKSDWEDFLAMNRCFTFQFQRRFIDLYSDSVSDASFLARDLSGEVLAIIPLVELEETKQLISHQKSSFGGFLFKTGISLQLKETIFSQFLSELCQEFPNYTLEIRTPPKSFKLADSAQERWLLWRFGFKVDQVVLHSIIDFQQQLNQNSKRIKYENREIELLETKSPLLLRSFWDLLEDNLSRRHSTRPTHEFSEIRQLVETFADEIRVFLAFEGSNHILGGLIFFNTVNIFNLQYMAIGELGRKLSVGDLLINHSLKIAESEGMNFFNFGHSHENSGLTLNYNLSSYKAKFGSHFDEAFRWRIDLGKFRSDPRKQD